MAVYVQHPQLGCVPAIPEPYWVAGGFLWLQDRPKCLRCKKTFKNRTQWETHYALTHLQEDELLQSRFSI